MIIYDITTITKHAVMRYNCFAIYGSKGDCSLLQCHRDALELARIPVVGQRVTSLSEERRLTPDESAEGGRVRVVCRKEEIALNGVGHI